MEQIAIYGSGSCAREVAWLVQSFNVKVIKRYEVVCFIDDDVNKQGSVIYDIPVMSLEAARAHFPESSVVGGIGAPRVREKVIKNVEKAGFGFVSLIHPSVEYSTWVDIGKGTVICAGSILTVDIMLGNHVQINLDCTISHDVILDDFATLAPGVHISGWVHIGKRVYIGTGATIINGTELNPLVVEDDAIVGAGACVIRSVQAGMTVVGVPAKPITQRH